MNRIFVTWLINTTAIMLAIKFVPGIYFSGRWWGLLLTGIIFGFVNTFIRPLVKLFTLPLLVLTLGLFTFIINAMMLGITSWISDRLNLGFNVVGFKAAFLGALLISIVSMVLNCILDASEQERQRKI
ncbi:MAG: phage holin family protein [Nitrospirae bacterium]|nr:MAG: phage holin family protein [Nitrospirota bacterium]